MHTPLPSNEVVEALIHIRDLFRRVSPLNESELRSFERREAATKDLLSNLPRTGGRPTLRTLLEIAEIYALTLEGAHAMFGYSLPRVREYDLLLNGGRTHIFESYPFERDLLIDLPAQLAPKESFTADALLRDLVLEWRTGIPLRALEENGWDPPRTFYVQIGTEDSLGSSLPPGALAQVESISGRESAHPNPRNIYLLQFSNGYRCSHCVVTKGKLLPFNTGRMYLGREEFAYPGAVRIAGRVRMFALSLPLPEYSSTSLLPKAQGAELILPWEHRTRDRLLAAKNRRFSRTRDDELHIQAFLKEHLHARLSARTERRYRRPTLSDPHVDVLIHLALAHMARYTDTLRVGSSWESDRGRYSLESLLRARSLEEAPIFDKNVPPPTPHEVWAARVKEFGGWPPMLSVRFPKLQQWGDRIIRLSQGSQLTGLDPALGPGSLLLIERIPSTTDPLNDRTKSGWSRPIYVLRRGLEIVCGHLDASGNQFALLSGSNGETKTYVPPGDFGNLSRVTGVAVPV